MIDRVQVPAALTSPCAVTALPDYGVTWPEILNIIAVKHSQQLRCNVQLEAIRAWSSASELAQ